MSKRVPRFQGSLQRESKSRARIPRPSIGSWATTSNPASCISVRISARRWKNASVKYKISIERFECSDIAGLPEPLAIVAKSPEKRGSLDELLGGHPDKSKA